MASYQLDKIDRQLLDLLQENARYAVTDLAERIGVSDNTIHNRMEQLGEVGVITGYTASIDHDRAGLALHFMFTCTARVSKRGTVAEEALVVPEVIEVTELMTGQRNLLIKVVVADDETVTEIAERLDQLALEINDENLIKAEHTESLEYTVVEIPKE